MLFRKTHSTKKKNIYKDKDIDYKHVSLYMVYTYWFLFIPVYTIEEFVE